MNHAAMSPRDRAWRIARRTRDWLRARGAWEPFEAPLNWLAPRIIPPNTKELEFTTPDGFRLALPPEFPSAQRYQEGNYEPELVAVFRRSIRPGWTVVDAGANVGYFTLLASRLVGPTGRVFSFEPDPTNFVYLARNTRANDCRNVQLSELALSDHMGPRPFRRDRFGSEGHLVKQNVDSRKVILVDAVTLDKFVRDHQVAVVHLIKFDIEGGEPAALQGATETIARCPGLRLVVEHNRRALSRGDRGDLDLFETLRVLGFRFARSLDDPSTVFPLNVPPHLAGHSEGFEVWR